MDALSLAACLADDFFDHEIPDNRYWDLLIYRLISNEGWLVTGTRSFITLDRFAEVAA
jgi:hypothetical protein